MALTIANSGGGTAILYSNSTRNHHQPIRRHVILFPLSPRTLHVVSAKKFSPRSGRFDGSRNRKSSSNTTTTRDQDQYPNELQRTVGGDFEFERIESRGGGGGVGVENVADDGYFLPELPGDKPDFWEGPQWDALGFFVEYLWAFGIVFAAIACLIAATTYNEGATDFKDTPAYKESVQSGELLEEPDASNTDVFESNPTEVAPSLE
ncbi:uncharacterized protein LOC107418836 [Ziziphus jujuba]|uniref:Uncharacterized protein LOC107418836 n=1 Tax=Ziziphus jujuba TaxID=326968 RepID=A0A6P3ZTM2_ZIZJJ|nr:uncharacterized protein LOC107418836 [Ziziphus jujuba]